VKKIEGTNNLYFVANEMGTHVCVKFINDDGDELSFAGWEHTLDDTRRLERIEAITFTADHEQIEHGRGLSAVEALCLIATHLGYTVKGGKA
jgi:hypothetical protein